MVESGIYTSFLLPCIIYSFLSTKKIYFKLFYGLLIFILFAFLCWQQNRAGILSLYFSFIPLFIFCQNIRYFNAIKKKLPLIGLLIFLLFVFFSYQKNDSTTGRLFIYKICLSIMFQNFPKGVGYHHYSVVFNHAQANYFLTHSIINKTALLANDGYFPLNEFLYIGIEFGIYGLIAMFILTFLILKKIISTYKQKTFSQLKIYSVLFFTNLFVLCLFSYPLHYNLVIVSSLIALDILLDYPIMKFFTAIFKYNIIYTSLLILIALIGTIFFSLKYYQDKNLYKQGMEDLEIGHKTDAINKFKSISSKYVYKYGFIESYANALYMSGKTNEAILLMQIQHDFACNHQYHSTLGKWYQEIGDTAKAKENLEIALYIAPQYLQSRLDLLHFFATKDDSANVKFWAKQILDCPIKIPNPKANEIKKIALKYFR